VSLKVLVVEDEPLVAMLLEDMLAESGHAAVGPAGTVDRALEMVAAGGFDCAILDINLRGVPAYAVALALDEAQIPYAFTSGYGAGGVDPKFAHRPAIAKPIATDGLEDFLSGVATSRG
jgi:CheY-like chemotaxis protein